MLLQKKKERGESEGCQKLVAVNVVFSSTSEKNVPFLSIVIKKKSYFRHTYIRLSTHVTFVSMLKQAHKTGKKNHSFFILYFVNHEKGLVFWRFALSLIYSSMLQQCSAIYWLKFEPFWKFLHSKFMNSVISMSLILY